MVSQGIASKSDIYFENIWFEAFFFHFNGKMSLRCLLLLLRWLNTVLAPCEYMSFLKSWQEKDCSSQGETWQVQNIPMKDFD